METRHVEIAIVGAGTGGMGAYREARKYTSSIALIDGGPLGTTCARVGCMPSKLLIAPAEAAHAHARWQAFGLEGEAPRVNGEAVLARVRRERDRFVGFVRDAVENFNADHLIRRYARFVDPHTLELFGGEGDVERIVAKRIVLAPGSRPFVPPPFEGAGDRLVVNDDVFDWTELPGSVAVFGAGVIGLELGQALHRLGVRVHLFGRDHFVGPITDRELRDYAAQTFEAEFAATWHADATISRDGDEVVVQWDGNEERFDHLLAATGRRPNLDRVAIENAGIELGPRGLPSFDPMTMRIGESHIFLAGDASGDLPLLHEASDEGRIAGENAARFPEVYRRARRTPLGIAFTDPQIALVGETRRSLEARSANFVVGEVSFEDQGRSRVMLINKGRLHVYAEERTGRF
ncbi:MAG: dihydrolipoyl dehydrogenase, partial [Myxococcota bacterium]